MRFRSLPPATGQTSTSRRRLASPSGVMLPLSKSLLNTTLLGTTLGAGALVAGPLYAAPTLGSDANGPQVQILSPGYQDVLKGKFRILIAIKATSYNPASIEMFIDDRLATDGPQALESFPSVSFDFNTRSFSDGPHKLTVRVTDTQGFRGWAEVNVFVNNNKVVDTLPPTLSWGNLKNFEALSGTTQVQLQAADNFGVKWIYVSVNPTTATGAPAAKKGTMPSWLLNRPPYVVDFDTTHVPDGLYKLSAKAFDSNDQQGDAGSLTVGVVNNAINATTVGGLLDGLRSADAAKQPAPKVPVAAANYPQWGEALPLPPGSDLDALSGTRLGNQTASEPAAPKASPARPARVAKATPVKPLPAKVAATPSAPRLAAAPKAAAPAATTPEAAEPLVQPGLSALSLPKVSAPAPALSEAETPKAWGERLALAEIPAGQARAITEGAMSVQTSASGKLLARSNAAPIPADIATSWDQPTGLLTTPGTQTEASSTGASEVAALQVSDAIGAAVEAEGGLTRLARLSSPTPQLRVLDEPELSQPSHSARLTLSSVISMAEVAPIVQEELSVAVPQTVPVLAELSGADAQSKTRISKPALAARAKPVSVGIKPMPMQRAAAAWKSAKTGVGNLASKVIGRVSGKSTHTQIAALPRPEQNGSARGSITPAITVAPLEASEHVSIPLNYRVDRTTTLRSIAARYNLPVELVAACNGWSGNVRVTKGMTVQLPRPLQVTYAGVPVKGDAPSLLMGDTGTTAFRFLFEQSGGKLNWDAKGQRVVARKGSSEIVLTIGSKTAKVNDRDVMMELAAFLFEGRTMVPVRFFEEGLNAQVQWDPQTGRLVVAMAS